MGYLINQYPNNRYWTTAWDEKAYTQWAYLEDYGSAAQTWLDFVKTAPQSPSAAEYLFSAARTLERATRLEEAAGVWERIANEYSSSENVVDALHFAGISRYRLGDYDGAIIDFQRILAPCHRTGRPGSCELLDRQVTTGKERPAGCRYRPTRLLKIWIQPVITVNGRVTFSPDENLLKCPKATASG